MKSHIPIKVKTTSSDRLMEVLALLLFLAAPIYFIVMYPSLPDQIPTRFGFDGEVTAQASKATNILMYVASFMTYLMLTVITFVPQSHNYPVNVTADNAQQLYRISVTMLRVLKLCIMLLFLYITHAVIQSGLEQSSSLHQGTMIVLIGSVIVVPMVALYHMYQLKPQQENSGNDDHPPISD